MDLFIYIYIYTTKSDMVGALMFGLKEKLSTNPGFHYIWVIVNNLSTNIRHLISKKFNQQFLKQILKFLIFNILNFSDLLSSL